MKSLINWVGRRVPRRWIFLLGFILAIYLMYSYVFADVEPRLFGGLRADNPLERPFEIEQNGMKKPIVPTLTLPNVKNDKKEEEGINEKIGGDQIGPASNVDAAGPHDEGIDHIATAENVGGVDQSAQGLHADKVNQIAPAEGAHDDDKIAGVPHGDSVDQIAPAENGNGGDQIAPAENGNGGDQIAPAENDNGGDQIAPAENVDGAENGDKRDNIGESQNPNLHEGQQNVLPQDDNAIRADNDDSKNQRQDMEGVQIPQLYYDNAGLDPNGDGYTINVSSLSVEEKKLYDEGYKKNGFNGYLSDRISVDRHLPDARDPLCKTQMYPSDLPDTSVVICFLNEAFSIVVRSVHSIISTSPPHLLKEIILVDDNSDYENLKAPLEVYMRRFPKVRIIRNAQREGLIRSRLNGAAAATGQVVTFLDSHIECTEGWLQPLLARIKEDRRNVVWPSIPGIDKDTFRLTATRDAKMMMMGVFNWQLVFHWEMPDVAERASPISPLKTPAMAGGLFSMDRGYFYEMGSYDEEMRFWGAENLEISFRVWMCGGRVELIPCSVIGHIYREVNVNAKSADPNAVRINTERLAKVWMDEYVELYEHLANKKLDSYGDVSSRIAVREKLQCKSFDWYLKNVYTNVFLPYKAASSGRIRNLENSTMCLQSPDNLNSKLNVKTCEKGYSRNQMFYTTSYEDLRQIANCLDAGGDHPVMYPCHRLKGNQQFIITQENTIYQVMKKLCMQWKPNSSDLELVKCDGSLRQQWKMESLPIDTLPDVIRKWSVPV